MTAARPSGTGWVVLAPAPVGPPETLLDRLRQDAGGYPAVLGIDCPIGLPRAYAARSARGARNFPEFLGVVAHDPEFFELAAVLDGVRPEAPFYPRSPLGGVTRAGHAQAIGLSGPADLYRLCDRATFDRPAGAPLFWTLGANQVGRAAIAAWRDMLIPALRSPSPPLLWPFDGPLLDLLVHGAVTIAETYPAEAMRQIGLQPAGSKRRQTDRRAYGPALLKAMARLGAEPDIALERAVAEGFGQTESGEDRFDSVLGVLSILTVLNRLRPDDAPDDPWIRHWEGWILGQLPPGASQHTATS